MSSRRRSSVVLGVVTAGLIVIGCTPTTPAGPCIFTANTAVTAFRLPDDGSDVFGTISAGEAHEALARTADGWVGFDPGVAQAANVGLARHRWILLNASMTPSCLTAIDLVSLADVEADLGASG